MVKPVYINTPVQGKDIKLSIQGSRGGDIVKALENRTKMLGRVRGYEYKGPTRALNRNNNSRFTPPIYDLSEIARASDIEPYITQSIRKHREQILKEGYQISGTDEDYVKYIRDRLFEISLLTSLTTESWVRELVTNLVTYHNAYLIFRRDAKRSSGKPIKVYGKELAPIAGIFVGDPTTMEVQVDKYGTPRKWRQKIDGTDTITYKTYNIEDVVHVTVDKKTGFTFGTPYLLPVLDDIRALRKLEEVAIIVAAKEAFPLYHYKVGTEAKPAIYYEGGSNEVDQAHSEVQSLPAQGYIVTSERHEIKLVSSEGSALDLSPYLDYFEARVIAGLRLSPLDLGRGGGSSRGTATNINKGLQDSAKDYQQVISDVISHFVILPLLLEGGRDVVEDNLVKFTFPTIDREEERAAQNHGLQLYMGNAITTSEFRKQYLNKPAMTDEDEQDCNRCKETEAQKELAQVAAAAKASTASSSSDLGQKSVKNTISNKGQPSNQSGTKQAKSRFKANDYETKVVDNYAVHKSSMINNINDFTKDDGVIEEIFRDFVKSSVEVSKEYIDEAIEEGYLKARVQYETANPDEDIDFEELGNRAKDRFYANFVTKSFWKTITPYKTQINSFLERDKDNNLDTPSIVGCLNIIEQRIKILMRDQLITAERFGFIKFAKKIGSKTIDLVNPDTQDRVPLDISKLIYKSFIPTVDNLDHFLGFSTSKEES
tara:strand:+ start:56006 stop:58144 length:2139 start_codon:yes stop_codon:yes gene_type:complete